MKLFNLFFRNLGMLLFGLLLCLAPVALIVGLTIWTENKYGSIYGVSTLMCLAIIMVAAFKTFLDFSTE